MKIRAFTLAEVLIVMALIGFMFTLMIPNLVQKQSSTKFIEEAKTAQSKLQTALDAAIKANNDALPQDWKSVREASNKSDAIMKELAKKLQIMSFCESSPKGCFSTESYRTLNGQPTKVITQDMAPYEKTKTLDNRLDYENQDENFNDESEYNTYQTPKKASLTYTPAEPEFSSTYITLIEGGSVVLKTYSDKCNGILASTDSLERPFCGIIYVDVNGPAIPNMLGVDVFGFWLSGSSILPMGFYGDGLTFEYNCLRETPTHNKYNGLGCTAWALKNKNMEYRNCQAGTRLGWQKATRCNK